MRLPLWLTSTGPKPQKCVSCGVSSDLLACLFRGLGLTGRVEDGISPVEFEQGSFRLNVSLCKSCWVRIVKEKHLTLRG